MAGRPAATLTPTLLAQIFSGQVVTWDDPAIVGLNPSQGRVPPAATARSMGPRCKGVGPSRTRLAPGLGGLGTAPNSNCRVAKGE